eukprot:CAMPEP_0184504362 /NCGR_PEP_ID=MMETSP0113_2-20130426/52419_1 /TAXON_ID=91329 /ORGANISM="Norrisiella sphaerica, Strain BC52" /LENGTH=466 /DNA_ID=CAMNT_0026894003 /DNA_START=264 /DNA_END=1664 /DNA_ORIENTATION=-
MGCGASGKANIPAEDAAKVGIWTKYQKQHVLGTGMSCAVYSAKDRETNEDVAIKELRKYDPRSGRLDKDQKHMYDVEISILKNIKHKNCIEFVGAQEEPKFYYLITKLCKGGELFDRVKDITVFTEKVASDLAKQMLEAVEYLHQRNIVHRDLKPENFVFESTKHEVMKLIDFGCAVMRERDDDEIKDNAGSPYYVAPEVLNGQASTLKIWKACDIWSIGVIVYLLIYGLPPFFGKNHNETYTLIRKGRFSLPKGPSKNAKSFIKACLRMETKKRITTAEALKHDFVTKAENVTLHKSVRESLATFHGQTKLKKAVARMIAKHMTDKDRKVVQSAFREADKNGDGKLDAEEISSLLKSVGKTDEEIKKIVDEMDTDNDGGVNRDEFAQMHATGILGKNTKDVKEVFTLFDKDGDGMISHDEISQWCDFMTPDKIKEALGEVDVDGNGKISFEEWEKAMMNTSTKKS